MNENLWLALVNNASMLLALFVVYELSYFVSLKHKYLRQVFSGLLISAICIAIMALPFRLLPGVVFDTRSILISTTALILGPVPTVITAASAIIFRLAAGGAGTLTGVSVILASALVGLVWRRWFYPKPNRWRWLNIYVMSLIVHAAMLACMNFIPYPSSLVVIREIAMPVMLMYPVASLFLSMLLLHQRERRLYQDQLKHSAEKYKRITENITDTVWTMDLDLNTTYISPSVEKQLGEPVEQHMKRTLREKLPPQSVKIVHTLLSEELQKETDPSIAPERSRIIELEHYRADGSLVWLSMNVSFIRDANGKPIGLQGTSRDISAQKQAEVSLRKERDKSRMYLDIARVIMLALDQNANITLINKEGCKILGLDKEDIIGKPWIDSFVPPGKQAGLIQMFAHVLKGNLEHYKTYENPVLTASGDERLISWQNTLLYDNEEKIAGLLSSGIDITEQKAALESLRESERSKRVLLSHLPGMAYRCSYDPDWTMQFVSDGCFALTGYQPESLVYNKDMSFNDIIAPEYWDRLWREWERSLNLKLPFRYEYEIITATKQRKWVLELGQGIYDAAGHVEALEGIIIDISLQKQREAQILYMTNHDSLTGLYNRKYYEESKHRLDTKDNLPLSIITLDINGIRLINDAYGHEEGDRMIQETATIIRGCCSKGEVLARTGGDEFGILLPNTDQKQAYEMVQVLKSACEGFNTKRADTARSINLSIGFGTKQTSAQTLKDSEKEAEEYMNKNKLLESKSHHSAILSSVMATMYARSQETEAHAERLAELSKMIGQSLGLPQKNLDELELLSMLHDIGKVGIDDHILNKPGKLSDEEWAVMRKHSEIGYRIAKATPELESVAKYILSHHERWDGTGYPQGLKGTQIPLLSRILSVADAYDAMTEDRVYRKALSKDEALEEIKAQTAKQFDPAITEIFIKTVFREMTK